MGVVAIRINVMRAGAIMEECGDRAGKEWCAITGIEADYQGVSPRCFTAFVNGPSLCINTGHREKTALVQWRILFIV